MRRNCIALENGMRTGPNKRLPITVSQIKLGIAGIVVQWIVVKTWFAQEKLTTWVARVLICVTLANFTPNLENKCLAIGACQCKMEIVGINAQWIAVKIAQKCKEVFQNLMF